MEGFFCLNRPRSRVRENTDNHRRCKYLQGRRELSLVYQDHIHAVTRFSRRFFFDLGAVLELSSETMEEIHTKIDVHHLSTAEHHGDQNLVSLAEKTPGPLDLHIEVMVPDLGPELDLLALVDGFFLTPALLGLLVPELAKVHQLTGAGVGIRSYFHEINFALFRNLESFADLHDTHLLSLIINQAALTYRVTISENPRPFLTKGCSTTEILSGNKTCSCK